MVISSSKKLEAQLTFAEACVTMSYFDANCLDLMKHHVNTRKIKSFFFMSLKMGRRDFEGILSPKKLGVSKMRMLILPIPGEAKAKAMPGRLYIHTRNNNKIKINKTTFVSYLNSPRKGCPRGKKICVLTHLGLIKLKTTSKKTQKRKTTLKKNLFSIPLKFRGKPFLGLAQLS